MRKSQKTEQADRQRMIGLEDQRQTGARSIASGEGEKMSGTQFQALVLARNNLNLAYQRVVRNKGAAGVDGMTVDELKPYLKVHREDYSQNWPMGLINRHQSSKSQFQSPTVERVSLAFRP